MTDVLIKNWCIPECCMDCDPDFAYAIKCKAYNENNDFTRQRAENCPLVEIKHSQDGDTIRRADAIEAVALEIANKLCFSTYDAREIATHALSALPSAERNCFTCGMENGVMVFDPEDVPNEAFEATDKIVALSDVCKWLKANCQINPRQWVELASLPSAEADPTVIRSRTFMPTKDFKEWVKRIREENPNAVVIPCDAEVVSAEAVHGWIPCSERLPKEKEIVLTYDNIGHIDFGQYDRGQWYWEAEACADYWMKNDGVIAWMPLPKPYEGGGSE